MTTQPTHDGLGQGRPQRLLTGSPGRTRIVNDNTNGGDTVHVSDVVPGTPAASIWAAVAEANRYACAWPERPGDSLADLLAALDGIAALEHELTSALLAVRHELEERVRDGVVVGVEALDLLAAGNQGDAVLRDPYEEAAEFGPFYRDHLAAAIARLRAAFNDATATGPDQDPGPELPPSLARSLSGKSAARIREMLGEENFMQRHRSKTRATDYTRADHITQVLRWMDVNELETYPGVDYSAEV